MVPQPPRLRAAPGLVCADVVAPSFANAARASASRGVLGAALELQRSIWRSSRCMTFAARFLQHKTRPCVQQESLRIGLMSGGKEGGIGSA